MARKKIITISLDEEVLKMIEEIIEKNKAYTSRSHLLGVLVRLKHAEITVGWENYEKDPF